MFLLRIVVNIVATDAMAVLDMFNGTCWHGMLLSDRVGPRSTADDLYGHWSVLMVMRFGRR